MELARWNLPAGTATYESNSGHYCAIGKLMKGCGIEKIFEDVTKNLTKEASDFSYELGNVLQMSPGTWGTYYNDTPMYRVNNEKDHQLAHELACRQIVELALAVD